MPYDTSTVPEARARRLNDPRTKTLFHMYNDCGLTHTQIAAEVGLSPRTVQQLIVQYVRDLRTEALDKRCDVSYN